MNCPRCQTLLHEYEPGQKWLRYFLCPECWIDFHFEDHALVQGKLLKEPQPPIVSARA